MKPPQESSRRRAGIRIGVAVQIFLAFVLLCAVNYVGFNYYWRGDWSPAQKYRLSDQTKELLRQLPSPATFYVFFSPTVAAPGYEIYGDVVNILKEYQFAAGDKLTVEYVDFTRNMARARELQAKYGFGPEENIIIAEMGGRSKQIIAADMAEYDLLPQLSGEPPRVQAFKGEQELTGALLALVEKEARKVYFLQGQGEPSVGEGSRLSLLGEYIGKQGMHPEELDLGISGAVPPDAAAVVIVGARYDASDNVMAALRDYWSKDGRIMVLLDPAADTPLLREFLSSAGIRPRDDRVLRAVKLGFATGILRDVNGRFSPDNRITRRLAGAEAMFPGGTCSLDIGEHVEGVTAEPMITAAEPFWGEIEYITDENKGVAFDEGKDTAAPVVIAAMAEKGGVADVKVDVSSGRLIAVGNFQFAMDGSITAANLDFLLASLNWMADRGHLTGITPKSVRAFSLNLTDIETGRIAFYTLVVIPAVALVAGFFVWVRRRR